ncbi:MAG: hypothetical protein KAH22_02060 [Thiotrichaceae bacterium]|nr:hypothetical protein [Thiotrichaceae bacterium]
MTKKTVNYHLVMLGLIVQLAYSFVYADINPTDWDNDGLSDRLEQRFGSSMHLADTDGDGISDKDEFGSDENNPLDTDGDEIFNFRDIDDDGDGIPSVLEGIADGDGDNIPNYLDLDSDNDTLGDRSEVVLSRKDHDNDGLDDVFDADKDMRDREDTNGDGVLDHYKFIDRDGNGAPDIYDPSSATKKQTEWRDTPSNPITTEQNESTEVIVSNNHTSENNILPIEASSSLALETAKLAHNTHKLGEEVIKASSAEDNSKLFEYGGSGYFYCMTSGRIVAAVEQFTVSSSGFVTILDKANQGHYVWGAKDPGIYSLQFNLKDGFEVVSSFNRGRRIIKKSASSLLTLGVGENLENQGYMIKMNDFSRSWYRSFEFKEGGAKYLNNNIPLTGSSCEGMRKGI